MSIKSVEILPAIPGADLLGRLLAFDPTRRLSVVGSPAEFLATVFALENWWIQYKTIIVGYTDSCFFFGGVQKGMGSQWNLWNVLWGGNCMLKVTKRVSFSKQHVVSCCFFRIRNSNKQSTEDQVQLRKLPCLGAQAAEQGMNWNAFWTCPREAVRLWDLTDHQLWQLGLYEIN